MNNDLISHDALNDIWKLYKQYQPRLATNVYEFGEALKDIIDNVPTVTSKQGEWKLDSLGAYCSECGTHPDYSSNFCPNCGASMKGGAEE